MCKVNTSQPILCLCGIIFFICGDLTAILMFPEGGRIGRNNENGEIYGTVGTMMVKPWQRREIVGLGMLHYEHASRFQKTARQNGRRYFGESFHIVRGVGKHNVIRCRGVAYVTHGISAQEPDVAVMKFTCHLLYETSLHGGFLD